MLSISLGPASNDSRVQVTGLKPCKSQSFYIDLEQVTDLKP